ncbi:MAG: hypothetical protein SF052_02230 [Bacteroidia bacterium]|nr:hypothetical protein [Bacteroidia bacterium]
MPKSTTKTYPVTCPCDQKHNFEIGVTIKEPTRSGGSGEKSFTVEKYCPFCDRYVEFTIPDEPFNGGEITRE